LWKSTDECYCIERCECICGQLVSEEHDESNAPSANIGPLSGMTDLELTRTAEHVHKKDITIWIDPLDATQEYTGMICCLSVKSHVLEKLI